MNCTIPQNISPNIQFQKITNNFKHIYQIYPLSQVHVNMYNMLAIPGLTDQGTNQAYLQKYHIFKFHSFLSIT